MLSTPIHRTAIAFASLFAASALATAPAIAQSYSDVELIEGYGVGDHIVLGMTRDEVEAVKGDACDDASSCDLYLSSDTALIQTWFDAADTVSYIRVTQNHVAYANRWATTAGAIDGMSLSDVQALYPGSILSWNSVTAEADGYTYTNNSKCTYTGCVTDFRHDIYEPTGGGDTDSEVAYFVGNIEVTNPLSKTAAYDIDIDIEGPDGSLYTFSDYQRIHRNETISYDPADFLSTDSELGVYTYTASLYDKRGRLQGTSSGDFDLTDE